MLNWPNLTMRQKTACVFMVVIGIAGSLVSVFDESRSPSKILEAVAASCLLVSVLLHPALVQGGTVSDVLGQGMPRPCMFLALSAVGLFMASGLVSKLG